MADDWGEQMLAAAAPRPATIQPPTNEWETKMYAVAGRPEWSDKSIPVQTRTQDFLKTHAAATPTEGGPDTQRAFGVPYQYNAEQEQQKEAEVLGKAKNLFPEVDQEQLKQHFRLQRAVARQSKEGEGNVEYAARSVLPGKDIGNWARSRRYGEAIKNFNEGKASQDDIEVMARYERLQQIEGGESTGAATKRALLGVPGMVGEAVLGGAAVKGAGKVAPFLARAGAAPAVARLGIQTAAMPSMYLKQGAENQLANPDESTFQSYAPAYGMGVVQTAVLGQLAGRLKGVPTMGGRLAARTGLGLAEQQGVDTVLTGLDQTVKKVTDKTLGLDTKYGLIGSALRGDDDVLKQATVQTITFAAFATMHGNEPAAKKIQDTFKTAAFAHNANHHEMIHVGDVLQGELQKNPSLTRSEARAALDYVPEGPVRNYAMSLADALPAVPLGRPQPQEAMPNASVQPEQPRTMDRAKTQAGEMLVAQMKANPNLTRADARKMFEYLPDGPVKDHIEQLTKALPEGNVGSVGWNRPPEPNEIMGQKLAVPKELLTPRQKLEAVTAERNHSDVRMAEANRRTLTANANKGILYPNTLEGRAARKRADDEHKAAHDDRKAAVKERKDIQKRLDELRDEAMKVSENPTEDSTRRTSARQTGPGEPLAASEPAPVQSSEVANRAAEVIPGPQKTKLGLIDRFKAGSKPMEAKTVDLSKARGVTEEVIPGEEERAAFEKKHDEAIDKAAQEDIDRWTAASKGEFDASIKEAGLTPIEEHVVRERVAGRTHAEIAKDAEAVKTNGERYEGRAAMKAIEKRALKKMGSDLSIAKAVHEKQKAEGAARANEAAAGVTPDQMHHTPETAAAMFEGAKEHWSTQENKLNDLLKDAIKEDADAKQEGRKPDPERWATYAREGHRISEGSPPEREKQEAPLRKTGTARKGLGFAQEAVRPPAEPSSETPAGRPIVDLPKELQPPPRMRNESDWSHAERDRRAAGAVTIAKEIRTGGGLNPDTVGKGEAKSMIENGMGMLFKDERKGMKGTKGKQAADELAMHYDDGDVNELVKMLEDHRILDGEEHWQQLEASRKDFHDEAEHTAEPKAMPAAEQRTENPDAEPEHVDDEAVSFGFGAPLTAEERGMIGGGGAYGANGQHAQRALKETALANARVDKEREHHNPNLPPLMAPARLANPKVWDAAMTKLAIDPNVSARLVDELHAKTRPTSVEENALLLHRKIALNNEYTRTLYKAVEASFGPKKNLTIADQMGDRADELLKQIDKLDRVTRSTGTEWGRSGQFRRQLAREDFTLSKMMLEATAAKGKPLTAEEKNQITDLQKRLQEAQDKLAQAQTGEKPAEKTGLKGDMTDLAIAVKKPKQEYDAVLSAFKRANRPLIVKVFSTIGETANASRAFITAYDLSAALRQGAILTFAHPIKAARALTDSLRQMVDVHHFEREQQKLQERPNALNDLYHDSGLYLANLSERPNAQEEAFIGRWVGKIPGVAASERAYTGFLNRMRADVFDSMIAGMARNGKPSIPEAQAIANFVNKATGRGTLPGKLDDASAALAHVFFSPRYLASRFQILAGQPFFGGSWRTRGHIVAEYGRTLAGLGVFYGIMAALNKDAEISFDPRSADFGKIKLGNTRVDPLAGLAQVTVFGTRLITGETKSTGEDHRVSALRGPMVEFGGQTESDVIGRFLRSKLAPVPGTVMDALTGKSVVGEKVTPTHVAGQLLVPISIRDVWDSMKDQGVPRGLAVSLLAILGMGTQVYEQKPKLTPAEKKKAAEEDRPLLPVMFKSDITPRKLGLKREPAKK